MLPWVGVGGCGGTWGRLMRNSDTSTEACGLHLQKCRQQLPMGLLLGGCDGLGGLSYSGGLF